MKYYLLLIYAGESEQDGTQCGTETKRRIEHTVRYIRDHQGIHFTIILAAGTRPDKPEYPLLKNVMKEYFEKHLKELNVLSPLSYEPRIIVVEDDVWRTWNESLAAYSEMKKLHAIRTYICTSWYHLPRVLLTWNIIAPKVRVRYLSAPSALPWYLAIRSMFREILGMCKVCKDWYESKH